MHTCYPEPSRRAENLGPRRSGIPPPPLLGGEEGQGEGDLEKCVEDDECCSGEGDESVCGEGSLCIDLQGSVALPIQV